MVDVGALSDIESRRLAEQGNLLYYSTSDYFVVKAGMSIRDQLDCRRELEEGFFKEWQARRFLTVFPRSEKELNKFQAQMDASMAEWDWDVQLLVASVINLKNFKRSAKKTGPIFMGVCLRLRMSITMKLIARLTTKTGNLRFFYFAIRTKMKLNNIVKKCFTSSRKNVLLRK